MGQRDNHFINVPILLVNKNLQIYFLPEEIEKWQLSLLPNSRRTVSLLPLIKVTRTIFSELSKLSKKITETTMVSMLTYM